MGEKLEALLHQLAQVSDLQAAAAVLGWDQEVYMPDAGITPRAHQLATLNALAHEMFTSSDMAQLLEAAEAEVACRENDSDDASRARVTRRLFD